MKILTVLDSIGETNMPFNEFIRYRLEKIKKNDELLVVYKNSNYKYNSKLLKYFESDCNLFMFFKNIKKNIKKCDVVHLHHPFTGTIFFILYFFMKTRKKSIYTVHSNFPNYTYKAKFLTFLCFLFANKVTFVSNSGYNSLPNYAKKIINMKSIVIQNGVDTERLKKYRKKEVQDPSKIRLITIGRMVEAKNQLFLLNLVKSIPNAELIFIGKGKYESKYKRIVQDQGIVEKVIFKGLLTRESVYKELKKSDIFLSSSKWEGMPIAVLEALGIGIPVIISNIEPHLIIKEQVPEVEVLDFNILEWKEKIKEEMENDLEKKKAKMKKLQISTEKYFSLRRMNEKYIELYRDIGGKSAKKM